MVKPFDPNLKTELLTDSARLAGMGYALIQKERDSEGQRLICCGSKAFTPTQQRYSTMEVECLGVVWAIKHCKFYLLGMKHFAVLTDHRSLVGVFKQPLREVASPRCRILREKVAGFNFEVQYVKGKTHYTQCEAAHAAGPPHAYRHGRDRGGQAAGGVGGQGAL